MLYEKKVNPLGTEFLFHTGFILEELNFIIGVSSGVSY